MVLRILLVEPDDSTRQIITLLLRKCNYKVATVSNGLKAWELLNQNPHSIDLVLTEVELPSISGFALLSLIIEHHLCKNIPVIMMSPHDSVTTVYKCMLKGAADFLVKPVRKNELNNLWQHVWRRKALASECNEESQAQQKVEATAENYETSNCSGGYTHKNENSDVCTKPDMGAEECDVKVVTKGEIDLIGSFGSFTGSSSFLNHGCNKVDDDPPSSMFGLSLRLFHPSSQVDEKQRLKQSDSSAFSRYINRTTPCSNLNQQKLCETTSDTNTLFKHRIECDTDAHSAPAAGSCQHGQDESQSHFSSPKQKILPFVVAVSGLRFDNSSGTPLHPPPILCIQPHLSPLMQQSPNSSEHLEPSLLRANLYYKSFPELAGSSSQSQEVHNLRLPIEQTTLNQDIGHFSSATDHHNASSNFHGSDTNKTEREAALNKFRMKRKDRCYDKKVRYESRKKLAEQRPRVKGQFARQLQASN